MKADLQNTVFTALENGVKAALETYSNVHRGSGLNSMVSTHLYEKARDIVLEYLGIKKGKYTIIFCTPRGAAALIEKLKSGTYQSLSSREINLPIGVVALAVKRRALPKGAPFQTGGGTTRLISPGWVVWASVPDRFEAGTPAIINVIAFAKALQMVRKYGKEIFLNPVAAKMTPVEIIYHDDLETFSGRELLDNLRPTLVGYNHLVPTTRGPQSYVNLDNSASTPTFAPVWKSVCQAWHQSGKVHQEIIREVKSICAAAMGAPLDSYDVIFTSNTTEAINLAAESFGRETEPGEEAVVLSTLLEHSSNDLPWRMVPGNSLVRMLVDEDGIVDLKELESILSAYNEKGQHGRKRIKLMAMSGASNVLGVYNDIPEISWIIHKYGARLLVDAAQLVAHRKVDVQRSGIDYLAFSAHKVYAPFGTGVLIVRKELLKFSPAETELIRSSGEENAAGIAALGKALVLLQRIGMELIREEEEALTVLALQGLETIPGLRIYGIKDPASPTFVYKGGVIVFSMKGWLPDKIARQLAERGGIGVRYGCHCAHILIKHLLGVGPFLQRFQRVIVTVFPNLRLPGVVRVSLGIGNSKDDIDRLIRILLGIASKQSADGIMNASEVKKQMKEFVESSSAKVYSRP